MTGKNSCKYLSIGKTTFCSRRCIGQYCFTHLSLLRNGGGTKPCAKCGKGIKTRVIDFCMDCGYYTAKLNFVREFREECKRLSSITI